MSQQNITDEDILNLASLIENMNINSGVMVSGNSEDMETEEVESGGDSNSKRKNINYEYFNGLFGPGFEKLDKNQQKLKIYQYLIDYLSNLYKN